MRNEHALRRTDFHSGFAIPLADGQVWTLPMSPLDPAAGRPRPDNGPGQSGYWSTLRAVAEADDEERPLAELVLVIYLLNRNYQLRPADYQEILDAPEGHPDHERLRVAFARVADHHLRRWRDHEMAVERGRESIYLVEEPTPRRAGLKPWLAGIFGL